MTKNHQQNNNNPYENKLGFALFKLVSGETILSQFHIQENIYVLLDPYYYEENVEGIEVDEDEGIIKMPITIRKYSVASKIGKRATFTLIPASISSICIDLDESIVEEYNNMVNTNSLIGGFTYRAYVADDGDVDERHTTVSGELDDEQQPQQQYQYQNPTNESYSTSYENERFNELFGKDEEGNLVSNEDVASNIIIPSTKKGSMN